MGNDMEKMIEMLMGMLGSNSQEEEINEIANEPQQEDEELNEISGDTLMPELPSDNTVANLLGGIAGGKDKRVTLLSSIKPYMNGKRQEKVDMAINFVKLMSVSSTLGFNFFDKR